MRRYVLALAGAAVLLTIALSLIDGATNPNDLLRWGWTILTLCGLLFALRNLREAILDEWALAGSTRRADEASMISARGVVWDMSLKSILHAANFGAGVSSLLGFGLGALAGLVISALVAIILSYGQMQRHRALLDVLRRRNSGNR